jgi:predicted transcriptional regulator
MDEDVVRALRRIGREMDRPVSWLIRRACEEFVERSKKAGK